MNEKTETTTAGKPSTEKAERTRVAVNVAGPVNYERQDYPAGAKVMALPQDVDALKAVKPVPAAAK